MTRASRREYHIIYRTTCTVTQRFYIGMHSTDTIDDGYLGSGVRLLRSVRKYGKDEHIREVLEILPSREQASIREKAIITEEVRSDPLCMNCGPGGLGSTDRPPTNDSTRAKISAANKARWSDPKARARQSRKAKDWCSDAQNRSVIVEAAKSQWADPEQRAKRILAQKASVTEAYRVKLSEAQKARWSRSRGEA